MATSVRYEPLSKPEQIKRLVQHARQQGKPDGVPGKRRWPRFTTGMRLEVTTDPSRPSLAVAAIMHNVSEGGFAFWSKRELSARTQLFVREFESEGELDWLPARVRHCTSGILGHLVGAQFEEPPTEESRLPGRNTSRRLQESLRSRRLHR